MNSETVQQLMNSPIGKNLSAAEASELAQAGNTRSVGRDDALFRIGDQGDALFIILDGGVKVVLGNPLTGVKDIATLGPGQVVGELEVMTKSLRVATVVATQETTALEIGAAKLDSMLSENSAAANKLVGSIARTLARRLAAVNQRLVARDPAPVAATAPSAKDANIANIGPIEVADADLVGIDDDDLDVLDKLWG
ncbi:MAG: cyclic nucleotide-binding domain-containing protein [Myxococcota bacterium]